MPGEPIGAMELFAEPAPVELTLRAIRDSAFGARSTMLAAVNNCEAMVWANPWGLTAQEVFDALGPAGPDILALKQTVLPIFVASGGEQPRELRPADLAVKVVDGRVLVVKADELS